MQITACLTDSLESQPGRWHPSSGRRRRPLADAVAGRRPIGARIAGASRLSRTARRRPSPAQSWTPDHTLSPTALVHEAYLRLLQQHQMHVLDRNGLLAVVGLTMRRILVDHARSRTRQKRGGVARPVRLEIDDDVAMLSDLEADEVLAVDVALERLARLDDRARQVVEYRVFAGLTLQETADVLGISSKSVQRTWTTARAWLRKELRSGAASADDRVPWRMSTFRGPCRDH